MKIKVEMEVDLSEPSPWRWRVSAAIEAAPEDVPVHVDEGEAPQFYAAITACTDAVERRLAWIAGEIQTS